MTFEKRVRLLDAHVCIPADPSFARSPFARKIRALGGHYNACRGYDSKRYVTVKLNTDYAAAPNVSQDVLDILDWLMRQQPSHLRVDGTCDLTTVGNMYLGSNGGDCTFNLKRLIPNAQHIVNTAFRVITTQGDDKCKRGVRGWSTDPDIQQAVADFRLRSARELVKRLRAELETAEDDLATLVARSERTQPREV